MATTGDQQLFPNHQGIIPTFSIIAVCSVFAVIFASIAVVLHFPITVFRATRTVSALVVTVATIILAGREITAAARRGRSPTSTRRSTISASVAGITSVTAIARTIAARVESPGSGWRSTSPLELGQTPAKGA